MKEERRVVLLVEQINRILDLMGPDDEISFVLLEALESKKKNQYSERDMKAAETMYKMIKEINPHIRKPIMERWADTIRIMRQRDKITHEQMGRAFVWANNDRAARGKWPGWAKVIQSPDSLREHYPQIAEQMSDQYRPSAPTSVPYYKPEVRT